MRFKNKKTFALLVLLTFLFTSLFSTNLMGGARVAEATMGEDCSQIAERITEKDLVTPHWFDKFCINHIDIMANLVATVYVDGEPYQEVVQLTPADAKYVEITAMRNGHPVAFEQSDISVYSVDMFGNAQIRINGIFPIGTKANPVVYTVKITKPVTVDTVYGDMTVPVTFVVPTHYWDVLNTCPALTVLRTEWAKGLFILGSGIDIALGGGSGEVEAPCGYLTIQKVVQGVELDEYTSYFFDIIDEDGNLYKTSEALVKRDTGLVTVLNVPYGTYQVVERTPEAIDGYRLAKTEYSTEDGYVTVSKANRDAKVVVTNWYETVEIPEFVTNTDFGMKKLVAFEGNVPEAKQQEALENEFAFDVKAVIVGEDTLFDNFEDAQNAAKNSDLVIEQIEVKNAESAVDVISDSNNNYSFRLDNVKHNDALELDWNVRTATGQAYIWLFVSEDAEAAAVDGLDWTCNIYRGTTKIVTDGNQLFAKLTTNSAYQFENIYSVENTETEGGGGGGTTVPDPEPGDGGGTGGTTTPDPDNDGSGGTDNPDKDTTGSTDSDEEPVVDPEEPAVVEPGVSVEPEEPAEELPADVPRTGDSSQTVFYVLLLLAAVAGLVGIRLQSKR